MHYFTFWQQQQDEDQFFMGINYEDLFCRLELVAKTEKMSVRLNQFLHLAATF
jgi:hypothetical protein